MKLVQDSSQNKAAAALLGAGFPTPGETGSTGKRPTFAEDLRQHISEAVAGSRTRLTVTNPQPADPKVSSAPAIANAQPTSPSSLQVKAHDPLQNEGAEGLASFIAEDVAEGGMFLPLSDQSLPTTHVEGNADGGYAGTLAMGIATTPVEIDFTELPSLFDAATSNPEETDNMALSADDSAHTSISFVAQPLAFDWLSEQDKPAVNNLHGLSVITDIGTTALSALHQVNSAAGSTSELNVSDNAVDTLLNAAVVGQQRVAADTNPGSPVVPGSTALPDLNISLQGEDSIAEIAAIKLTAAYDLSLPDVMPSSPFDPLTVLTSQTQDLTFTSQVGQTPAALNPEPFANTTPLFPNINALAPDISATENAQLQSTSTVLVPANPSTYAGPAQLLAGSADQTDSVVDLQTKGVEPVSSASTRSAYVNSLLANLLGTGADAPTTPGLLHDLKAQGSSLLPQNAALSMQTLSGLANGLIPTKSTVSDQQLLASVGATSNESTASFQSASLYNMDQRLQQAAEARLAHLQGVQQSNTSVESSTARMSGTGLAGLDVTFGQPGWVERVGRQLLLQSAQGNSSAQIQLDPPELGSLTIKIQLVDQAATVHFVSPHAMVRDALEQQAQRLQEMLNEQGMNLRNVSVSDQSANSGQQSDRQSGGQGGASGQSSDSNEHESVSSVHKSISLIDYYA